MVATLTTASCENHVQELIDNTNAATERYKENNPAGVLVLFSNDLILANNGGALQVKLIADDTEYSMVVRNDSAWIDWEILNFGPTPNNLKATTENHNYNISIFQYIILVDIYILLRMVLRY